MDTTEERWLPIVGYENYEVSDLGRVRNVKSGKIKISYTEKTGYITFCLSKNGKQKTELCHRLVLKTFFPIDEKLDCDHINHDKSDNRLCNLRWATKSQNSRNVKKRKGTSQYLGVSWSKTFNKWRVNCRLNLKDKYIGLFDDEHDAGRAYNEFIIKNDLQDFTTLNDFIL